MPDAQDPIRSAPDLPAPDLPDGQDATLRAIAALPGDWHDSGNLGEAVVLRLAALLRERFPHGAETTAETGCGKSTLLFSRLARRHLCFTLDDGDAYAKTRASPLLRADRVTFIPGPSQRTLQRHDWDGPLDAALIDGGHAYPFPELDYYGFYPQLRTGGLLIVDDIHIPTIAHLHAVLREDPMWRLVATESYTAFFERTGAPTFDPFGDNWPAQPFNRDRFPHKEWLIPVLGPDWWKR